MSKVAAVSLPAGMKTSVAKPAPPKIVTHQTVEVAAQPGIAPGTDNITAEASISGPAGTSGSSLQSLAGGSGPGWQESGDAGGTTFELTFNTDVTVSAVGMVPGDDSTVGGASKDLWGKRRVVSSALVSFDDGEQYLVTFATGGGLARVDQTQVAYLLAPETTRHVTIKIEGTERPASADAQNETVISQLVVLGQ